MDSAAAVRPDALELAERIDALFEEAHRGREHDALVAILRTARNARRSGRRALPTPRVGMESCLDLIAALAAGALGEPL